MIPSLITWLYICCSFSGFWICEWICFWRASILRYLVFVLILHFCWADHIWFCSIIVDSSEQSWQCFDRWCRSFMQNVSSLLRNWDEKRSAVTEVYSGELTYPDKEYEYWSSHGMQTAIQLPFSAFEYTAHYADCLSTKRCTEKNTVGTGCMYEDGTDSGRKRLYVTECIMGSIAAHGASCSTGALRTGQTTRLCDVTKKSSTKCIVLSCCSRFVSQFPNQSVQSSYVLLVSPVGKLWLIAVHNYWTCDAFF